MNHPNPTQAHGRPALAADDAARTAKPDDAKRQPEALATFAAAARREGRKPDRLGYEADAETAPIPADPAIKDEAATRVLREGVLGSDQAADAAADALPDRTRST
jgi:hypothetical protein